jgi:hypothetical protein
MPVIKRTLEELGPVEEGPPAKSQRLSGPEADGTAIQAGHVNFGLLPKELQLSILWEVANQSDRQMARQELDNLRLTSKSFDALISKTPDLKESYGLLHLHPGVSSRYDAMRLDVAGGMSVMNALRQNGPLPGTDEKLRAEELHRALQNASLDQLTEFRETFKAQTNPALKAVLAAVQAGEYEHSPERLQTAGLEDLVAFAGFSRISDSVAANVFARRDELLPHANVRQIARLAEAASVVPDDVGEHCLDRLALEVNRRHGELLPEATTEQLAALRTAFDLTEEYKKDPDYEDRRAASELAGEKMTRRDAARSPSPASPARPKLDDRDQSRERGQSAGL